MDLFPTIETLAQASSSQVLKAWEGLGYYRRALALHEGAILITQKFGGKLPETGKELRSIPGIGPYTEGAILSFGFHQKAAAIDGNVSRVISRLWGWKNRLDTKVSTQAIRGFVDVLLQGESPWVTMEALIELGACVCTPMPKCHDCPLQQGCLARKQGIETVLPLRKERKKTEIIHRCVLLISAGKEILIRERPAKGLMAHLYEFPYIDGLYLKTQAIEHVASWFGERIQYRGRGRIETQFFTSFKAILTPYLFDLVLEDKVNVEGHLWIEVSKLQEFSFSSGHKRLHRQVQTDTGL
jgi:A/G-specific adenine glycosylase